MAGGLRDRVRAQHALLVQMYFLFYVLPLTGLRMSPLATGVLALGLHYAAYCAEVYRAGIEAAQGQTEAAIALNLPRWRTAVDVCCRRRFRR